MASIHGRGKICRQRAGQHRAEVTVKVTEVRQQRKLKEFRRLQNGNRCILQTRDAGGLHALGRTIEKDHQRAVDTSRYKLQSKTNTI